MTKKINKTQDLISKTFMTAILCLLTACSTTYRPVYDRTIQDIHEKLKTEEIAAEKSISNMSLDEIVEKGRIYLNNGNMNLAKIFFVQALNKEKKHIPALLGIGDIFLAEGQIQEALELFIDINKLASKEKKVLFKLATTYRMIGRMDTAIDYANQGLLLDNQAPEFLNELALVYDAMGNYKLAEPLYRSVINVLPASSQAFNNLGCNLLLQDRYKESIAAFSQASSFSPNNIKIKNNLATAYALNDKEEKALDIFRSINGEAEARNNLGYLYMTLGEWDKAESSLTKAMETNPVFYVKASQNLEKLKKLRSLDSKK